MVTVGRKELATLSCSHPSRCSLPCSLGFPGGSVVKNPPECRRCRRCGFDPWVGTIPWRRKCYPLQYSCLGNPMDSGAWWATVCRVTKTQTRLND